MNTQPAPVPGTRIEHLAAHTGHVLLYVLMFAMVVTGYTGTGVDTEYFFMFDIPKFESTQAFNLLVAEGMGLTFEAFEKPVDFIHKDIPGAWAMWILIAGHAAAALYHHYVKKDRTLYRITTGGDRT